MKITRAIANKLVLNRTLLNAARFYFTVRDINGGFSTKFNLPRDRSLIPFSDYQIKSYLDTLLEEKWVRTDNKGWWFFVSVSTITQMYCGDNSCQSADIPEEVLTCPLKFRRFVSAVVVGTIAKTLRYLYLIKNQQNPNRFHGESSAQGSVVQPVSIDIIRSVLPGCSNGTAMRIRQWAEMSGMIINEQSVEVVLNKKGEIIECTHEDFQILKEEVDPRDARNVLLFKGIVCCQCANNITFNPGMFRRKAIRHGKRISAYPIDPMKN